MTLPLPVRLRDTRSARLYANLRDATSAAIARTSHLRRRAQWAQLPSFRLTLFRKLMLFYGGLLALVIGSVLVGSHFGTTMVADDMLSHEFAAESRVFENIREARYDQMQQGTRLLASDFGFRSAFATGDTPTIESALHSMNQRMRISEAFLIRTDGTVIGLNAKASRADVAYLVDAVNGGATRGVLRLGDRNYQTVAAPINAPDLLGWVVCITQLGDREMTMLTTLSAIPLRARIVPIDQAGAGIPIVKVGSWEKTERTIDGERMLIQASRVASFGPARPQALILEYSLTQALPAFRPIFRILLASCIVALMFAIAGSVYVARRLASPIEALSRAVERVALGDYAQVATTSDDEIGKLAADFNKMVRVIRDREQQIERTQIDARAKLEIKVRQVQVENKRLDSEAHRQRSAVMREAAAALEATLAPLLLVFDAEATRLIAAASDMRKSQEDAMTRASEARRSAQRTEALTLEMAGNTIDLVQSSGKIADEAGSTLDLVRDASKDSATATASFADLRAAVQEIGSVTGEIRSISDRTNMLALNATIEAARAGVAGQSFSVVAAEVKALAGQTAALTVTIAGRLTQVRQAMIDADGRIGQVSTALSTAASVADTIAAGARGQSNATDTINQGILHIAEDNRSAVAAISRIDRAATESTRMADQMQGSAEAVAARVSLLRGSLEEFLSKLRAAA